MSESRREYMRRYHQQRKATATPKPCQRCGERPKAPGTGQRYCQPCKEGDWTCEKCGEVMAARHTVTATRSSVTHFCRTCSNARSLARYNGDREKWQTLRAVRAYGITEEEYAEMLARSGGLCEVCGEPPAKTGPATNRLHIDHDHDTGEVRGLLCHNCNLALGHVRDRMEILSALGRYLARSPSTLKRRPALIPTVKDEEWATLIPTSLISVSSIECATSWPGVAS